MILRCQVGSTNFEVDVPPEFEDMINDDPEGLTLSFRGVDIFRGAWVDEPCDSCAHPRELHRGNVQECLVQECACEEWWKVS